MSKLFTTSQLNALSQVGQTYPALQAIFLFGSQTDGYARPNSDIDLGLLTDDPLTLSTRLKLEVALCQALERENLDCILLNQAPILLRFRAIQGQILYEKNPILVSDFMQNTMHEYYDFQHVLNTYQREFANSLGHTYGH